MLINPLAQTFKKSQLRSIYFSYKGDILMAQTNKIKNK